MHVGLIEFILLYSVRRSHVVFQRITWVAVGCFLQGSIPYSIVSDWVYVYKRMYYKRLSHAKYKNMLGPASILIGSTGLDIVIHVNTYIFTYVVNSTSQKLVQRQRVCNLMR